MHNKQTVYDTEDYKEYLRKRNKSSGWNEKVQSYPQQLEEAEQVLAEYIRRREYWLKESIAAVCQNEIITFAHYYYILWCENVIVAENRLHKLQSLTAFSATIIDNS